jgi:hypothetical protein
VYENFLLLVPEIFPEKHFRIDRFFQLLDHLDQLGDKELNTVSGLLFKKYLGIRLFLLEFLSVHEFELGIPDEESQKRFSTIVDAFCKDLIGFEFNLISFQRSSFKFLRSLGLLEYSPEELLLGELIALNANDADQICLCIESTASVNSSFEEYLNRTELSPGVNLKTMLSYHFSFNEVLKNYNFSEFVKRLFLLLKQMNKVYCFPQFDAMSSWFNFSKSESFS